MNGKIISVIGSVGVPANYGGFETLVENLAIYHHNRALPQRLVIYCSKAGYQEFPDTFLSSELRYLPLNANGVQSILYDIASLLSAAYRRSDEILILGVSGAIALPMIRLLSSANITINIDGIEWRREKWRGLAKWFLRFSEMMAVRFSHSVVSDNEAISDYVNKTYGVRAEVIAYGGDHAVSVEAINVDVVGLPSNYSLSICRIEPENNVHLILDAFSCLDSNNLIFVGNWNNSEYGRRLRHLYSEKKNIFLLDPIYDTSKLKALRQNAKCYLHGHSAGGTNPSLVEAMHFGKPVMAFDCDFNRFTTENKAFYFSDSKALSNLLELSNKSEFHQCGMNMIEIANRRYTWNNIARQYFCLLGATSHSDEI